MSDRLSELDEKLRMEVREEDKSFRKWNRKGENVTKSDEIKLSKDGLNIFLLLFSFIQWKQVRSLLV